MDRLKSDIAKSVAAAIKSRIHGRSKGGARSRSRSRSVHSRRSLRSSRSRRSHRSHRSTGSRKGGELYQLRVARRRVGGARSRSRSVSSRRSHRSVSSRRSLRSLRSLRSHRSKGSRKSMKGGELYQLRVASRSSARTTNSRGGVRLGGVGVGLGGSRKSKGLGGYQKILKQVKRDHPNMTHKEQVSTASALFHR